MSPHRHATRLAVIVLLAGGLGAVTAAGAGAATAPLPVPSVRAPSPGADPVTTVQDTVTALLAGVGSSSTFVPGRPSTSGSPASTASTSTTAPDGSSSATSSRAASSSDPSSATSSTQPARRTQTSSSTSVRAATPVATVCLIPTAGSPAFEVGLDVVGRDLSSPLVHQFPQAFAPCPAGAVRADGETVAAVDATVHGLVGACVRVTRQVVPLQTTVVVLDADLILDLVEAGAPLDQLVVPCPAGSAAAPGQGAGSGTSPSARAAAASSGAGESGALPDLLAFTGTEPGPVLFAAVALLCSGAVLVRKAQLLAAAARG